MRLIPLAMICAGLATSACSASAPGSGPAVTSVCDLSDITPKVMTVATEPAVAPIAGVSAFGAITGQTNSVVSIQPSGETTALGNDNQPHHAQLSAADLASVQQCIDKSGFLDLADGFAGGTTGSAGQDKWCSVSDAAVITVTATGSSGTARTASGIGPGFDDTGCDFGYPDGLVQLHAALDQVRAAVSGS